MNRPRSFRTGACIILAYAVLIPPASSREIERVEWHAPPPRPDVSFTIPSEGTGILVTLTPRQDPPANVPRVTAERGDGGSLRVLSRSATTWLIESPAKSFVFVRVGAEGAEKQAVAPVAVYSGPLDEALQSLRDRVARLPAPADGSGLLAVLQRDMRAWVVHRLQGMAVQSTAATKQVPSGALVNDLLYAEELLRLLEEGRDSVALSRGRQLPGRRVFDVKDGNEVRQTGFDFVMRLPKSETKEPWPLLVLVHGSTQQPSIQGARREEIEVAAALMDFPFMTVGPVVNREMRAGGGWNAGELAVFVESLTAQYPVDRDRVYLSGFSAGGFATVATVLRRPDLFAAYAPLCGAGDPAIAPALAGLPVYLYHGDADTTVPCFSSVRFFEALEAAGGQPNLRLYQKLGHAVWNEAYRDVEFYRRLLAHRRVPLVATPPGERESEGNRLEFYDAPPIAARVCWIDPPLKFGDLWDQTNSWRQLQRKLELLYPSLPVTGNVLLHCPEGWNDASSPVSVGIAVKDEAAAPSGYVIRSLRTGGRLTAAYRGEFQIAGLAEATRRFQVLRNSEANSVGKGLVMELEGSGRRAGGGARVVFRASAD